MEHLPDQKVRLPGRMETQYKGKHGKSPQTALFLAAFEVPTFVDYEAPDLYGFDKESTQQSLKISL